MKNRIFWFRRDLRLHDNTALSAALSGESRVLPVFIFDPALLKSLPKDDARVTFIYSALQNLHNSLATYKSGIRVFFEPPLQAFQKLAEEYAIEAVYANEDYEPYPMERDKRISNFLRNKGIAFNTFKDHVVFSPIEILKSDGTPYAVYTPYKNKWLQQFSVDHSFEKQVPLRDSAFMEPGQAFPEMVEIGFTPSAIFVPAPKFKNIRNYGLHRDFPALEHGTGLGPHLRFGTVSIREAVRRGLEYPVFLSELIWREFFIQVLYHRPDSAEQNFYKKFDAVQWLNREEDFEKWKKGETGYPFIDAGMRELAATGTMHNRARMVAASFLTKHLLVHWSHGERYFAEKLLDFELASNVGNWQWAAGTGCDASPWFRVFNPDTQQKKFDPNGEYRNRWLSGDYFLLQPIIEHSFARERALAAYKAGVQEL